MKIAVVTTFNQKLYDYYAHRFMKTYNWPFDLYVYHEGWIPEQIFDMGKLNNPVTDIIDSYYIAKVGNENSDSHNI